MPGINLDKTNKALNKIATEYEGTPEICPHCHNHLELIANEGFFCKFCGQHIDRHAEEQLHDIIRTKRIESQMKQFQVAKELGITSTRLCLLEKGKAEPNLEELRTLSHVYSCSVNEFFGQPAPRKAVSSLLPKSMLSCQDFKRASDVPMLPEKVDDYTGYDNEYIYVCPICGEEIDLSPGEALTVGLAAYEVMKERSTGNDGVFCKHCGQAIQRPVVQDENQIFEHFKFWIKKAL